MTKQTVIEGDFDLSEIMAKAKSLADSARKKGEQALAKIKPAKVASVIPENQITSAIERAAVPAYDLFDEQICNPQLAYLLTALDKKKADGKLTKAGEYEADRQSIIKLPAIQRKGRRAAISVILPVLPLLPKVACQLGAQVLRWAKARNLSRWA